MAPVGQLFSATHPSQLGRGVVFCPANGAGIESTAILLEHLKHQLIIPVALFLASTCEAPVVELPGAFPVTRSMLAVTSASGHEYPQKVGEEGLGTSSSTIGNATT
jgi:hypothetical protein